MRPISPPTSTLSSSTSASYRLRTLSPHESDGFVYQAQRRAAEQQQQQLFRRYDTEGGSTKKSKKDKKDKKVKKEKKAKKKKERDNDNHNNNTPTNLSQVTEETVDQSNKSNVFSRDRVKSETISDRVINGHQTNTSKMGSLNRQFSNNSTVSGFSTLDLEGLTTVQLSNLLQEQHLLRLDERSFFEDQLETILVAFAQVSRENVELKQRLDQAQANDDHKFNDDNQKENGDGLCRGWCEVLLSKTIDQQGEDEEEEEEDNDIIVVDDEDGGNSHGSIDLHSPRRRVRPNKLDLTKDTASSTSTMDSVWLVCGNSLLVAYTDETEQNVVQYILLDRNVIMKPTKRNMISILSPFAEWVVCADPSSLSSFELAIEHNLHKAKHGHSKHIIEAAQQFGARHQELLKMNRRLPQSIDAIAENLHENIAHHGSQFTESMISDHADAIVQLQNDIHHYANRSSSVSEELMLDMIKHFQSSSKDSQHKHRSRSNSMRRNKRFSSTGGGVSEPSA